MNSALFTGMELQNIIVFGRKAALDFIPFKIVYQLNWARKESPDLILFNIFFFKFTEKELKNSEKDGP